jgi:hypothetical protein
MGDPSVFQMIRFVHVDQGADGMWATAGQRARHLVGGPRHKSVRTIAVVKHFILANYFRNVGVPGHQPKWIKAFGFDSTKGLVRAKPLKSSKKRFLPRVRLGRCDEKLKATGYPFTHLHSLSRQGLVKGN